MSRIPISPVVSIAELDFTVDARARWTTNTETVVDFVLNLIPLPLDVMYPAYKPDPKPGPLFIDTIGLPAYGAQNWSISTTPPAATDTSWVQQAQVLAKNGNHTLQSAEKAVLHATFNVCEQHVAQCPFNHDPPFALIASTDHTYDQTEKATRAIASIAM